MILRVVQDTNLVFQGLRLQQINSNIKEVWWPHAILFVSVQDPDPNPDPDPPDPRVFGLADPDLLVRGMDPDPDQALDPDQDPTIIMQN